MVFLRGCVGSIAVCHLFQRGTFSKSTNDSKINYIFANEEGYQDEQQDLVQLDK